MHSNETTRSKLINSQSKGTSQNRQGSYKFMLRTRDLMATVVPQDIRRVHLLCQAYQIVRSPGAGAVSAPEPKDERVR